MLSNLRFWMDEYRRAPALPASRGTLARTSHGTSHETSHGASHGIPYGTLARTPSQPHARIWSAARHLLPAHHQPGPAAPSRRIAGSMRTALRGLTEPPAPPAPAAGSFKAARSCPGSWRGLRLRAEPGPRARLPAASVGSLRDKEER